MKIRTKRILSFLVITLLLSIMSVNISFAQGSTTKPATNSVKNSATSKLKTFGKAAYGTETSRSLSETVALIINSVLGLFGILLLLYLILGAYQWMMAGGDQNKVTKAKDTIKNAIIGLIIIVVSFAVANFVINALQTAVK
jgi:hypothetical protein